MSQEDHSCHVTFEQRRISEDFGLVDFATKCHQYLGFAGDFPTISRIFQDTMDTVPEGNDGPPFNQKIWKGMMDMSWILTERKSFPFHWKYLYFCSSDTVDCG